MGNAESSGPSGCNVIDCGDEVTHGDINRVVQNTSCCERDRKLMQHARAVLTAEPRWVRQNMQLTCYGEHGTYNFVSGAKTNQYVVQFNGKGEICSDWAEKGWMLWGRDTLYSIWQVAKEAVGMIKGVASLAAIGGKASSRALTEK